MQEIVVTAQRREEKLSKVPISVVAYNAEALQTRNIASEQDISFLVPGLQVKNGQNSNQLSYSMRGQSLDPFSGTSPAVLPYLNEFPRANGENLGGGLARYTFPFDQKLDQHFAQLRLDAVLAIEALSAAQRSGPSTDPCRSAPSVRQRPPGPISARATS